MNKITNALGVLVIIAAVVSVFYLKYTWTDTAFGIMAGCALIYTKSGKITDVLGAFNQGKEGKK